MISGAKRLILRHRPQFNKSLFIRTRSTRYPSSNRPLLLITSTRCWADRAFIRDQENFLKPSSRGAANSSETIQIFIYIGPPGVKIGPELHPVNPKLDPVRAISLAVSDSFEVSFSLFLTSPQEDKRRKNSFFPIPVSD